jgi:hypothetical protein
MCKLGTQVRGEKCLSALRCCGDVPVHWGEVKVEDDLLDVIEGR